ncbi:S-adenosyl-L-methionine-dependent methyltransferase [Suillus cothurnatus]|nr:S-adenosyl-L-methionine-dependent methyltransferase [Suillus cothurnatus]
MKQGADLISQRYIFIWALKYRSLVGQQFDAEHFAEIINEPGPSSAGPLPRDDDTHYFSSYCENDIHAVMIQDKVRTSTYASFILTNPIPFRDASGEKHVYAVDASNIAEKAEQIVKANGLENVIIIICGKFEEISLPDDVEYVDIIIFEWMGYALLYESMLDSVLQACDRFLKPEGGVMSLSQCRIMFGLCEGSEILKERVEFWSDVYGFDLSVMANDVYEEAIVDVVGPDSMASEPYLLKDLHLNDITTHQLDFTSQFTLVSTTPKRTKIHAFVLYFDTFFMTTGESVPPEVPVKVTKEGYVTLAEVWPVGGKALPQRRASTGPGIKQKEDKRQTIFLLRDPIHAEDGTIVMGSFYCKKSATNSRELDVEIHYSVRQNSETTAVGETVVQI